MIEKVNPSHPDKLADRIAGAIVDLAYRKDTNPKIAVEILLGHGNIHIIIESNVDFSNDEINPIVERIAGKLKLDLQVVPQDVHLAGNQEDSIKCGDNGIFKGVPLSKEEKELSKIARDIYKKYPYDGKYVLDKDKLVICQSNAKNSDLLKDYPNAIINPLGEWTGGSSVDSGAVNRKLGSDMGRAATGGGLFGKDTSKADVSVNIWAHLQAQKLGYPIECVCAIGDTNVCVIEPSGERYFVPFATCVNVAKEYIAKLGGFEKFAEWGLIR